MKIAIFALNGELMCFAHALLNALDLEKNGHEVQFILEGSACGLLGKMGTFEKQWKELIGKNLLSAVCKACSNKMGTLKIAEDLSLPVNGEMFGHPSMNKYLNDGYQIITF